MLGRAASGHSGAGEGVHGEGRGFHRRGRSADAGRAHERAGRRRAAARCSRESSARSSRATASSTIRSRKDMQITAIRGARDYLGDRLIRTAKPHQLLDPAAGPLIAVRLNILTRKTLGGLQTDLDQPRAGRRWPAGAGTLRGRRGRRLRRRRRARLCARSKARSSAAAFSPAARPAGRSRRAWVIARNTLSDDLQRALRRVCNADLAAPRRL